MAFIPTKIAGVMIFEPQIFKDDRGYFFESYNQDSFKGAGIETEFVQDNQSFSTYGTIRGLHAQTGEFSQAKLVRVTQGKVLDVVVDIRDGSPTYGEHISVELSAENNRQLYIPRGFLHGFSVLSETTIFVYKCDNFYNKDSEIGFLYDSKILGIDWQLQSADIVLSAKDAMYPEFTLNM